ncbi:MAG: LON peptidase substrate-binding domain-containing protein [Gemmatimonadaceae bacterium]
MNDPATRAIPLFPLPLVLFPEARLPLHIFEPRYRQMLVDVSGGRRQFGIVRHDGAREERDIPPGTVGCIAHLESSTTLPDGRSNIVVRGTWRFALEKIAPSTAPYLMALVSPVTDRDEPDDALNVAADALRTIVRRVATAARSIADEADSELPLPDDPRMLSFAVAQSIDLELTVRQSILENVSPLGRLRQLRELLERLTSSVEERALAHHRAKSNGHGPHAS